MSTEAQLPTRTTSSTFPAGRIIPAFIGRLRVAALAFLADSRDPTSLVALGSAALIILGAGYVILTADPDGVRAHPPPPPSRVEIRQAVETSKDFSTTAPAERPPQAAAAR